MLTRQTPVARVLLAEDDPEVARFLHPVLFGGSIPLLVRILSVADVHDALASPRPYGPPLPKEKCLDFLRESAAGGGLDPLLVESFTAMVGSA
jgi:response regulator RpfG family c-di-GMP phosphodiesterase